MKHLCMLVSIWRASGIHTSEIQRRKLCLPSLLSLLDSKVGIIAHRHCHKCCEVEDPVAD